MTQQITIGVSEEVWECLKSRKKRGYTYDKILREILGINFSQEKSINEKEN